MQDLPSKFSNLASCHLISSIGLSSKSVPHYFLKSICRLWSKVLRGDLLSKASTLQQRNIAHNFSKEILTLCGVSLLIRVGSACLFLKQSRGLQCYVASFKPELEPFPSYRGFSTEINKSEKPSSIFRETI